MNILQRMSLTGRTALITGAAGGLGQTIAKTLAELGADLVLVDRPGSQLDLRAEELASTGARVECRVCDLEQSHAREALIATLAERERLDILINNAAFVGTSAIEGWATHFEKQSVDTWRRALEVNLTAPFALSQGLAPNLRRSRGTIVNIGSIYGLCGPDQRLYEGTPMGNPAGYAASKGGLLQLTRWLATTLAPEIRVNAISPGGIWRAQPEAFVKRYVARTPLQRMATEDDFAGAVAYLCSDLSNYVTGHNLVIDGGWSAW